MNAPSGITFKGLATGLICCAVVVAFLNLYMNILATRSSSSFQIDLSADGDVVGFHQFDFPDAKAAGSSIANKRRRKLAASRDGGSRDSCMGLCPGPESLFSQVDYVKNLIHARMRKLASNAFRVALDVDSSDFGKARLTVSANVSYWKGIWDRANAWVSPRRISAPSDEELANLIRALNGARAVRVSTPTKGTQLKVMLELEGGQRAVWKPKFLERSDVVDGGPTDGPDRHNGEIAAFYVGHLLGLDRTPFVAGRILHVKLELFDFADDVLRNTFFIHNSTKRHCFYGRCLFCSRSLPVCADAKGRLEGASVLWLPSTYANLTRIRSPWARTYDANRLAPWQTNSSFCRVVVGHDFFGTRPAFLDLMDTAVFDFLIGNADRHRLEFFKDHLPKTLLLLDNGKSFGNPTVDELTILAPLYQCCRIRRRLYQQMLQFSEINFGALLNNRYLRHDPLYPVLTDAHLEAINRRLRKVLALLASCIEQHGSDTVLVDDGY